MSTSSTKKRAFPNDESTTPDSATAAGAAAAFARMPLGAHVAMDAGDLFSHELDAGSGPSGSAGIRLPSYLMGTDATFFKELLQEHGDPLGADFGQFAAAVGDHATRTPSMVIAGAARGQAAAAGAGQAGGGNQAGGGGGAPSLRLAGHAASAPGGVGAEDHPMTEALLRGLDLPDAQGGNHSG